MAKLASSAFLTSASESGVEKPSRKVPIGWTILGATVFSLAIWYQLIVVAVKIVRHLIIGG